MVIFLNFPKIDKESQIQMIGPSPNLHHQKKKKIYQTNQASSTLNLLSLASDPLGLGVRFLIGFFIVQTRFNLA